MTITRRALFKGLLGGAAALATPGLVSGEEAVRRYWALNRTHLGEDTSRYWDEDIDDLFRRPYDEVVIDGHRIPVAGNIRHIQKYDVLRHNDETMWVKAIDGPYITVVRDFPWVDGGPFGDARPI
jgi:hypothetical protein